MSSAPAHFGDAKRLYVMHTCFTFVSRMWDMAVTLLLAELTDNSLFMVALAGLMSSLSIFVLSPYLGRLYDEMGRLAAVKIALVIKVCAVSVGYLGCAILLFSPHYQFSGHFGPMLYAVPFFCAIADLAFAMVAMGIQKDWIVVLSAGDGEWLSEMNSVMTQIDLASKSLAPALTGLLFGSLSYGASAVLLMFLNAAVTIVFFGFLSTIYHSFPPLWSRNVMPTPSNRAETVPLNAASSNPFDAEEETKLTDVDTCPPVVCIEEAPSTLSSATASHTPPHAVCGQPSGMGFLTSGCAGTMFGYSMLYFTVLSFGSLMTVYLKWAGMSVSWIGTLRGIGALTGFLGALAFPFMSRLIGLRTVGVCSIWYQTFFVVIAATSFFWASPIAVTYIISVAVLTSRVGLWMFDLAATQIAQETIPERARGKVNGQWRSVTACFDMLTYVVAVLYSAPRDFSVLSVLSAGSVFGAACLYTVSEAPSLRGRWATDSADGTGWDLPWMRLGNTYTPIPDSPSKSEHSGNSSKSSKSSGGSAEMVIPVLEAEGV